MADPHTRRAVLRLAVAGLVGGLAGCASQSPRESSTTTTATTQRETTPPDSTRPDSTHEETTQQEPPTLRERLEDDPLSASGDWPTFHYDDHNTSAPPDATGLPASGIPYWRLTGGLAPVLADGTLYLRATSHGVVACDARTGAVEWRADVSGGSTSLALADGTVVLTTIGDAYAFDAATGSLAWSQSVRTGKSSAPKVRGGTVYFCKDTYGSTPAEVYALDAGTGRVQWQKELTGDVGGTVALADETVYVSAGELSALDATTGDEQWTYSTANPIGTSPVVAHDHIYVADEEGTVLAVHADEASGEVGTEAWRTEMDTSLGGGGLAVADQHVYWTGRDGLYALRRETGEQRWQFETRAEAAPPTVADGTVYFGTSIDRRYCYAVAGRDGTERWRYQLPRVMQGDAYYGGVYTAPVVVDDAVYVSGADGYLYAFGPE